MNILNVYGMNTDFKTKCCNADLDVRDKAEESGISIYIRCSDCGKTIQTDINSSGFLEEG